MTTFAGWPKSATEFYEGLEADNSREYWLAHKDVYERDVRGPMEALADGLGGEFGEAHIFRPNRDIRFSSDKSPYKTAIGMALTRGFVQFSAAGLMVGAGCHVMAPDQLARYRAAVAEADGGDALAAAIDEVRGAGLEVGARESLKTMPRGIPADAAHAELLRFKDIAATLDWPVEPWLRTAAARTRIVDALRASAPLVDWLDVNVGPSIQERGRR